jgi:hypothetical protein
MKNDHTRESSHRRSQDHFTFITAQIIGAYAKLTMGQRQATKNTQRAS